MKSKYIFSLRRAGGKIRRIAMDDPDIAKKTRSCDGLLLPGGDDIEPSRYGQPRHKNAANPAICGTRQNGIFRKPSSPPVSPSWASAGTVSF